MKNNKKAEGTASSFLISAIVGITLIIGIGLSVNTLSTKYSNPEISYFEEYTDVQNNISFVGENFISNYDQNSSVGDIGFEDNLFIKAFKVVKDLPELSKSLKIGLDRLSVDLQIPPLFTGLIATVLTITLIALIVKIFRGFNNV